MKLSLELNGSELVLLYLATGNKDAGKAIHEAINMEENFYLEQRNSPSQNLGEVLRKSGPGT
jgi:hypothetical protein